MFSLTKKTEYALIALCCLAQEPDSLPVNTKVIAERYHLPVELLAKVLQQLARKALVTSTSGPAGGYRLSRPAYEVTVADVIHAVDGRPVVVQCLKSGRDGCEQFDTCTIRTPMEMVQRRMAQVLEEMTIRDLVHASLGVHQLGPVGSFRHPAAPAGAS